MDIITVGDAKNRQPLQEGSPKRNLLWDGPTPPHVLPNVRKTREYYVRIPPVQHRRSGFRARSPETFESRAGKFFFFPFMILSLILQIKLYIIKEY